MRYFSRVFSHQASSIKHQASSIKHQASSIKHQASSIKHQASSIKHQAPVRHMQTTHFAQGRKRAPIGHMLAHNQF
jgi:hypothetical protein